MGWTGTAVSYSRRPTALEAIELELGEEILPRVLDAAKKGSTVYAAVRSRDGSEVFGLVVLVNTETRRAGDGYAERWVYTKAMDDTMGPAEDECPARILDLLTPTTSEYAVQWRERCRENLRKRAEASARPKPKKGDTVRFAQSLTFADDAQHDTFVYFKGSVFQAGGKLYRIPRWRERAHTVEAAGVTA